MWGRWWSRCFHQLYLQIRRYISISVRNQPSSRVQMEFLSVYLQQSFSSILTCLMKISRPLSPGSQIWRQETTSYFVETGCWTELLERISQSMVFGVNTPVTDDVAKPPPSFLSLGSGSFSKNVKELGLKRHRKRLQHLLSLCVRKY